MHKNHRSNLWRWWWIYFFEPCGIFWPSLFLITVTLNWMKRHICGICFDKSDMSGVQIIADLARHTRQKKMGEKFKFHQHFGAINLHTKVSNSWLGLNTLTQNVWKSDPFIIWIEVDFLKLSHRRTTTSTTMAAGLTICFSHHIKCLTHIWQTICKF